MPEKRPIPSLTVVSRRFASEQLFVRTPNGEAQAVSVNEACTLAQLKLIVEDTTFVPAALQCLVVEDEMLAEEEATIEELGLEEGMELELLLEVEGGAKGDSRYKKSTSKFRWK